MQLDCKKGYREGLTIDFARSDKKALVGFVAFESIEKFLVEIGPVWAALLATTFTWLLTAAGAALVTARRRPAESDAR